jgi:alkaline phosphatase
MAESAKTVAKRGYCFRATKQTRGSAMWIRPIALAAMIFMTAWAVPGATGADQPPVLEPPPPPPRSAIFLHPDGMGANAWSLVRLAEVGPQGRLAWDELPNTAVYVGPMLDSVTATSNGGATVHAWGLPAQTNSYGMINGRRPEASASGYAGSLMIEAQAAGKAIGIVNSSSVTEPGTGAFLASVEDRNDDAAIAAQILASGADVILGGGEAFFLPRGAQGRHGPGLRTDGRNLIEEARAAGYTVIFTADEMAALPPQARRVLGLFAHEETFNEGSEQRLTRQRRPVFQPQAPRFDAMIATAIRILEQDGDGYFLVGNEEASDNLAGDNNAAALIEAGAGADRAIAVARAAALRNPHLTIIVASDSDCGGAQASGDDAAAGARVPQRNENGAPQDGEGRMPFLAAPDQFGVRHPFVVRWASGGDNSGGIVARGFGPGGELIRGTIDSTTIFQALHLGLFGD